MGRRTNYAVADWPTVVCYHGHDRLLNCGRTFLLHLYFPMELALASFREFVSTNKNNVAFSMSRYHGKQPEHGTVSSIFNFCVDLMLVGRGFQTCAISVVCIDTLVEIWLPIVIWDQRAAASFAFRIRTCAHGIERGWRRTRPRVFSAFALKPSTCIAREPISEQSLYYMLKLKAAVRVAQHRLERNCCYKRKVANKCKW